MAQASVLSIEALREQIRAIEGHSVKATRWSTGVTVLDELLGGLPTPGWVELTGSPGSGRVTLALAVAAQVTQSGQWVAWLDGDGMFYPPEARRQGVVLERLIVVRPVAERGAWAAEVLVSSGCFPWVVVEGEVSLGRGGARWTHASERGHCCACVISKHAERRLPAQVRLHLSHDELRVVRNRGGPVGGRIRRRDWGISPWS
jgi:hypothetical protein